MIGNSHIYHFLKVLLNRIIRKVSNESKLMQLNLHYLQDVFLIIFRKRYSIVTVSLITNEILIYRLTFLLITEYIAN